ncbi:MAG: hypothetical protein ACI35T_05600 [Alistipes sp.]
MKYFILSIAFCCSITSTLFAQEILEPEFIGEVIVARENGETKLLDKSTVLLRTRANAGAIIFGIGKAKTIIMIDGTTASTQLRTDENFNFIIKAVDNNTDPMSIVQIFRFSTNKKQRKAEISSTSTFGSTKSNKLEYLPFTAKKFGESSYTITLQEKPIGEYGIIVRNPNHVDEKQIIVSSFGITE